MNEFAATSQAGLENSDFTQPFSAAQVLPYGSHYDNFSSAPPSVSDRASQMGGVVRTNSSRSKNKRESAAIPSKGISRSCIAPPYMINYEVGPPREIVLQARSIFLIDCFWRKMFFFHEKSEHIGSFDQITFDSLQQACGSRGSTQHSLCS